MNVDRFLRAATVASTFLFYQGCECQESTPEGSDASAKKDQGAAAVAEAAQGKGTLKITAGSDFTFTVIEAASGSQVAEGNCNIHQPELPAGDYLVKIVASGSEITLGPATVEKDGMVALKLEGFGKLYVRAVQDFMKFEVKNQEGKTVGGGDTNITTLGLPVGAYTVIAKPSGLPPVEIKGVVIGDNEQTTAQVQGYALVTVKAKKDFIRYSVKDSEGKEAGTGDTNITTMLLPVGEYTLEAGGEKAPKLTLKEGDKLNFDSGW